MQAILNYEPNKRSRVCDYCYDHLFQTYRSIPITPPSSSSLQPTITTTTTNTLQQQQQQQLNERFIRRSTINNLEQKKHYSQEI
jgi:hypothetical protein